MEKERGMIRGLSGHIVTLFLVPVIIHYIFYGNIFFAMLPHLLMATGNELYDSNYSNFRPAGKMIGPN